jgi:hypothetical protein
MRKLALLAIAAGALFATAGGASAQYYYSGPRYEVQVEPRYRDYDYPRYHRRYVYEQPRYYRYRHHYARAECARRNWTVQDGVCKPYRGY